MSDNKTADETIANTVKAVVAGEVPILTGANTIADAVMAVPPTTPTIPTTSTPIPTSTSTTAPKPLRKDQIDKSLVLSAADIIRGGDSAIEAYQIDQLTVDGKPGIVFIRQLPAGLVFQINETPAEQRKEYFFTVITEALVTEKGEKLFANTKEAEASLKSSLPITAYHQLIRIIMNSSGIGTESEEVRPNPNSQTTVEDASSTV